jgi:hypothetical protein
MNDEDLRDLFAGLAMSHMSLPIKVTRGFVKGDSTWEFAEMDVFPYGAFAKIAYEYADAMIEAKYAKKEVPEGIASVVKKRKPKTEA